MRGNELKQLDLRLELNDINVWQARAEEELDIAELEELEIREREIWRELE